MLQRFSKIYRLTSKNQALVNHTVLGQLFGKPAYSQLGFVNQRHFSRFFTGKSRFNVDLKTYTLEELEQQNLTL